MGDERKNNSYEKKQETIGKERQDMREAELRFAGRRRKEIGSERRDLMQRKFITKTNIIGKEGQEA